LLTAQSTSGEVAFNETRTDLNDIKHRVGRVDEQIAGLRLDVVGAQEDTYRQQTRIDELVSRLERRLVLS
jgi:outer membrane murein-binding lipoprotein Lpp